MPALPAESVWHGQSSLRLPKAIEEALAALRRHEQWHDLGEGQGDHVEAFSFHEDIRDTEEAAGESAQRHLQVKYRTRLLAIEVAC